MSKVRELARAHTEAAITKLVQIMEKGESEQAQLGAANSLLDRGWGKPTQPIAGVDEGPLEVELTDVRERLAAKISRLKRDPEEDQAKADGC